MSGNLIATSCFPPMARMTGAARWIVPRSSSILTALYESHREQLVLWDTLSEELLEKQMKGIVGFKIIIDEVQAAFKLSQNRHERDYARIIEQLETEDEVEMAEEMKENLEGE
ncbi:hypothetical protein NST39_03075 [Bacillus sp. FSL W8-0645]|uniref:hypothetical protein n=1 Tax=Bacillus sp. FSL W8-0645 TaxID=2954627 RepID=UPI0030FC0AD5